MSAKDRAKVGDVFWIVVENFYKPEGSHLVDKEYCVVSGTVSKLLTEWDEMVLTGPGPDGYNQMHYYKNKDIGKRVFRERREAALYARELTEKNDRVWADMMGEKPMRRTWEKYRMYNCYNCKAKSECIAAAQPGSVVCLVNRMRFAGTHADDEPPRQPGRFCQYCGQLLRESGTERFCNNVNCPNRYQNV